MPFHSSRFDNLPVREQAIVLLEQIREVGQDSHTHFNTVTNMFKALLDTNEDIIKNVTADPQKARSRHYRIICEDANLALEELCIRSAEVNADFTNLMVGWLKFRRNVRSEGQAHHPALKRGNEELAEHFQTIDERIKSFKKLQTEIREAIESVERVLSGKASS
ncbi:hypothetical protein TWF696_007908 [Orbilia brochopaga]|uniref:Uncharacterized protein n=1 Tax=Orbilia brochopaga TaxID=3140254 RepID=A0AAV9ULX8_9PEZI